MARGPDASGAGVPKEHGVIGGKRAQPSGQEFGTDRLDARSFLDVVLQKLVERVGFGDLLFEEATIALVVDFAKQRGHGRLDVAYKAEVKGGAAANVFWVLIDLDFLHAVAGQEFRERKIGSEQQQPVRIVN